MERTTSISKRTRVALLALTLLNGVLLLLQVAAFVQVAVDYGARSAFRGYGPGATFLDRSSGHNVEHSLLRLGTC